MITKITIENIKGFSHREIDLELKSDKVNIIVAPNGYGKSSLATAFNCLQPSKLVVEKDFKYKKDENLSSKLSITDEGQIFEADETKNEISPHIVPYVVNNRLSVYSASHNMGRYTQNYGYLDIEDLCLWERIPKKASLNYRYSAMQQFVTHQKKEIPNIAELCSNKCFVADLENCIDEVFAIFLNAKKRKALIENIKTTIVAGYYSKRSKDIREEVYALIEAEPLYIRYKQVLEAWLIGKNKTECFWTFCQLCKLYEEDKDNMRASIKRAKYELFQDRCKQLMEDFSTPWKGFKIVERTRGKRPKSGKTDKRGKDLMIEFPQADEVSNGQRDVMTLVAQLIKFQAGIRGGKKYLLIIDEVFDYLDDANTLAAQYYLSKFIKVNGAEIYTVLLTHLSIMNFRNYVFNRDILNIQDLTSQNGIECSDAMKAFIVFRQNLQPQKHPENKDLYDKMSSHFFHYNPQTVDISGEYVPKDHLKSQWFSGTDMKEFVIEELNKYLSNQLYDPYSVCIGIRLRVEKLAYDKLSTQDQKHIFLSTHKTDEKLEYAVSCGVEIPDTQFFLSIIHNETDHLADIGKDKTAIYKLNHLVIRNVIRHLFGYQDGKILTMDAIH